MPAHALRSLAAMLAAFLFMNTAAGLVLPRFDASNWLIDLRWLPVPISIALIAVTCPPILAAWPGSRVNRAAAIAASILAVIMAADAARYWLLLSRGTISSDLPIPASALYAIVTAASAAMFLRPRAPLTHTRRIAATLAAAAVAGLFPILQMICFGLTDYRRPADAVLVFGARAYADGTASDALSDRVRAACDLYHAGLAPRLILSGGPGDGAIDEPEAMAKLARRLGVPDEALILDHAGTNTRASITNAAQVCREHALGRVLAVSHFYHLPRVKLEGTRAGLNLYTVPAPQGQPLRALPWFMARETAAWWWHFARAT